MPDLFVNPERDPHSEYTRNLPQILHQLGISLALATGRGLVVIRGRGDELNTHFIDLPGGVRGLYADSRMLVAATTTSIDVWRRVSGVRDERLSPAHDNCFLPVTRHFTGAVGCGEIAVNGDGEVYFANTLFSCISRLDRAHSFVPLWQPPFISACAPEDRCRLGGVALRDGRPAYASALGRADASGGWREQLQSGGVLIDVQYGRSLAEELCVPMSPRWHAERLWLLEAGRGRLCGIGNREITEIARVPGFARGLAFIDRYAFIGTSRVRPGEDLPVAESKDSACGVWMIDTETAQTVAFLRFGPGLDEIYGVSVLSGMRYPEVLTADSPFAAGIYRLPD